MMDEFSLPPTGAKSVPHPTATEGALRPTMAEFLAFSTDVTAFSRFELQGTGLAQVYLDKVVEVVGRDIVIRLFQAHARLPRTPPSDPEGRKAPSDPEGRRAQFRRSIFGDETLGPVARNIIKLWYVGVWYQLPPTWAEVNGVRAEDVTHTVSPEAYVEGLLWPAVGAHPPGAKAPGYGSWAAPPEIPKCSCEEHQHADHEGHADGLHERPSGTVF